MKNKKLKYVLIPLVIIVWGLIFYKVFSYSNDDEPILVVSQNTNIKTEVIQEKDSFELSLQYADPFLKKNKAIRSRDYPASVQSENNTIQGARINARNNRRKPIPPSFKATEISYGGEIINDNSKHITAVIRVAGNNKLLSDGDITGQVEILRIFNDSIHVVDQGKERTIFKK